MLSPRYCKSSDDWTASVDRTRARTAVQFEIMARDPLAESSKATKALVVNFSKMPASCLNLVVIAVESSMLLAIATKIF